jgi:hypothetical protein
MLYIRGIKRSADMIRKGDVVKIKPEWQDEGDAEFVWHALEDEDGGRVLIQVTIPGFQINPTERIETSKLDV